MVANGTQHHNGQATAAPTIDPHAWQQEYRQVHSWRQTEPPVLYTAKWISPDGIEHLLCVRGDTLDDLLPQIRVITGMIRTAKEKRETTPVCGALGSPPSETSCSSASCRRSSCMISTA
jgi:hypothetical protein